MPVESVIRSGLIQVLRRLPGAANKINDEANLKFLREVICHNQGRLANYYFLANRKHKQLKDKITEIQGLSGGHTRHDLEVLHTLRQDLLIYLYESFSQVCRENFEHLKKVYEYRCHKNKPVRVCVKAIRNNNIVTLVRDQYSLALEEEFDVHCNAAFEYIEKRGKYYICKDIPKGIIDGSYKNTRIHVDSVRRFYRVPGFIKNLKFRHSAIEDHEWQRCWNQVSSPATQGSNIPDISTCYKSTLVIPMTLLASNSSLSSEFTEYFNVQYNSTKVNIGFLCFDHRNINFFNEGEDVDLGYIFADLISLYLIQNLTCTNYSSIFNDSTSLLHSEGFPV